MQPEMRSPSRSVMDVTAPPRPIMPAVTARRPAGQSTVAAVSQTPVNMQPAPTPSTPAQPMAMPNQPAQAIHTEPLPVHEPPKEPAGQSTVPRPADTSPDAIKPVLPVETPVQTVATMPKQRSNTPVGAISLALLIMGVLAALAVMVYMQS